MLVSQEPLVAPSLGAQHEAVGEANRQVAVEADEQAALVAEVAEAQELLAELPLG